MTPYAVSTPSLDNSRWWRAAVTARRMTLEYMKYLAVLGREGLHRITGRHPEREAPPVVTNTATPLGATS